MKKQNRVIFAIKSRTGKRDVNQDALVCSYNYSDQFIAVVCDGVGSVKGSEYASNTVANTFADEFERTEKIDDVTAWFKQTLAVAIERVDRCSLARKLPGIATTLAVLIIANNKFYSFNIGDTRIYKMDKQGIVQISYDHNFKNYLIASEASPENIKANEKRWFALTAFIDPSNPKSATWDVNSGDIKEKTMFLLCTDGVYKVLNKQILYDATWGKKGLPLVLRASLLNSKALKLKSNDNVSNIVVKVSK